MDNELCQMRVQGKKKKLKTRKEAKRGYGRESKPTPRVVQFLQHNEYACGASEPFFNAYAIKSITSLEVTMGLTPTSFRRTKKYKFREYNWFR